MDNKIVYFQGNGQFQGHFSLNLKWNEKFADKILLKGFFTISGIISGARYLFNVQLFFATFFLFIEVKKTQTGERKIRKWKRN